MRCSCCCRGRFGIGRRDAGDAPVPQRLTDEGKGIGRKCARRKNSNHDDGKLEVRQGVVVQIAIIDIVFSFDTVMTAVGMSDHFPIMAAAVIAAVIVMIFAAEPVSAFVEKHPTVKMLALSFLILIGVALVADGLHFHIPKGYLYFAVAFSIVVEMLNLWARKNRTVGARGR